jgi:Ras-related protein Rab-7A
MCIFGDGGVGKTTLVNRYISGKYSEDFKMTIGVDFYTKNIFIQDINVSLQIWDFAGEHQFKNLLPNYVIGASGGIYMYDISRFYSITHLEDWINLLDKAPDNQGERMPILLVGGKKDLALVGKRVIEENYAYEEGQKFGVFDLIECSSKTGENVDEIFQKITRRMLELAGIL